MAQHRLHIDTAEQRPLQLPYNLRTLFVRRPEIPHSGVAAHAHHIDHVYAVVDGALHVQLPSGHHILNRNEAIIIPRAWTRAISWERPPRYMVGLFDGMPVQLDGMQGEPLAIPSAAITDFQSLERELAAVGRSDSPLLCQVLLLRMLIEIRRGRGGARPDEQAQDRLVHLVDDIMRQNLHRPLTRADVATSMGYSEVHLARLYRKATGRTLHARLRELRLQRAQSFLAESTLSVSQIAAEVGFRSLSHFARAFREAFGTSPLVWREAAWNDRKSSN